MGGGAALHLPVTAGATSGGVPPGSALNLPVPAGATSGGVPPGSALHLPVPAGATSGGVPPGSALHLAGAGPASNILEYLHLYAPMDSSAHGKYY